jgi:methylated-DNA-[protein]-cysteine S-methyltransferase
MSYGEVAAAVGSPGAARAVGQALGRNPYAIVVPCHRVLASGGRIGGFSATGGVSTKLRMLASEGVHPSDAVSTPESASANGVRGHAADAGSGEGAKGGRGAQMARSRPSQ